MAPTSAYASARLAVEALVERFARNIEAYKRPDYKETQVRIEFVDPFFEALGWDMRNVLGYAEQYKDVVHEDAIKVGGATRAPDYCFRIGGTRKFFLEAKKPSVAIATDVGPAYQLRRYAWSAKLPLSVLTDFEEFSAYDCQQRPGPSDKASTARVLSLTFRQYLDRFDDVYGVFAKEAVLQGSFDRYVLDTKAKRGTGQVDVEFLKEIEGWRDALARNIALRNPALSVHELNFAVQHTIDRIIFLRMAEDRGIEPYGRLLALCAAASPSGGGGSIYPRLVSDLYRQADEKYDSGLFDFQADGLTRGLTIDDKVLKPILGGLYYPASPYEFSVMPAEVLGQVYEQFLGKVIRLTAGHHAVVEEKPEVKKAGGVYYTPAYIVDYIVRQTVGKLVEGKGPRELRGARGRPPLRVLDPACGSGSFLLGAYQFLLDHYRLWYEQHDPAEHARGKQPAVYQGQGGDWRLTSAEKKRILLDHIYGVDIDRQAVEVTKLSLLLKVLEGETGETLSRQLAFWHERALPDLANNVKCGNSLIGPDYYAGRLLPDDDEQRRVNPFDWPSEFPDAMAAGGFDAVIGNPPWGAEFAPDHHRYLQSHYAAAGGKTLDSYALFIEAGASRLRAQGRLGFIVPDTFLRKDGYLPVRRMFFSHEIKELVETGPLFSKVRDTWCLVFVLVKSAPSDESVICHRKISRFVVSAEERLAQFSTGAWDVEDDVAQALWMQRPGQIVGYLASQQAQRLIADKIEAQPRLGELRAEYRVSRGEEGSKFALQATATGGFWMVLPKDVERYAVGQGLQVDMDSLTHTKCESIYQHPKIWSIRIQKMRWKQRIVCGLDPRRNSAGMKTLQSIVSIRDDLRSLAYLQGILASRLVNFWCVNYLADDINQTYLEQLPIRPIDFTNPADAARHDRMVGLVEQMLALHEKLAAATIPDERTRITRQIAATDRAIDALVYELYGLTDDDIRIVEGAGKAAGHGP